MARSAILVWGVPVDNPETWPVIVCLFLALEGSLFVIAEWDSLPTMWRIPGTKRSVLASMVPALILAFLNRPDKLSIIALVVAFLVCIAYGFSDYLQKASRNVPAFLLCFSLGSAFIGLEAWHAWPSFNVRAEVVMNGPAVYGLSIWNLQSSAVYPVGIAAYVRIENDYSKSQMIDSIRFEIRTTDNRWVPLTNMEFGGFYYGVQPNVYLLGSPLLMGELSNRNMQPGDNVSGWVFVDYPRDAQIAAPDFMEYAKSAIHPELIHPGAGFMIKQGSVAWGTNVPPYIPEFRAMITDMNSETTIVPVEVGPHRWGNQQPVYILVKGPEKNISGIPIQFARLGQ